MNTKIYTSATKLSLILILLMTTFTQSCRKDDIAQISQSTSKFQAKIVQQWMEETYNSVKRQGLFALDASRIYAYTAITMHESMVRGIENGRSLAGQLQGLQSLPIPDEDKIYDWGIVLCHATPLVLKSMIPSISSETIQRLNNLTAEQASIMENSNDLSEEVRNNSKEFAEDLAIAIISWSKTDNREGLENLVYTPPSNANNPQYWDGTTLGQNFMMPFWWTSRPFVINTYKVCEPEVPYSYSTDPSSSYYKDVKEVYDASFDPAKVEIGKYWANNPGLSGSPAGSWIGIANQLVDQYNLDIVTTLRMYVLLSIGTRDGFIACWYAKYKHNLQRPVSYIRNVMGHTNWESPVPTPPYPDYTSGTSVNAGASSTILTNLFGARAFSDGQHTDKGFDARNFSNFVEAGTQAFHSRIYGGVHMRRACEKGFEQGQCIAQTVINNLKFTK